VGCSNQRPRGLGGHDELASVGGADAIGQIINGHILEEIAAGPGLHGPLHGILVVEAAQDQDLDVGALLLDGPRRRCAVHFRHHHVHQNDIGLHLGAQAHRFRPAACFTNQLDVIESQQQEPQPAQKDSVIVHRDNADRSLLIHGRPLSPPLKRSAAR